MNLKSIKENIKTDFKVIKSTNESELTTDEKFFLADYVKENRELLKELAK